MQIGAGKFSEMCVRVRAYIIFKVRTCARTSARPFLAKKIFFRIFLEKMCGCACGHKNWGAGACAAHYENVCDVRAGADENPRTLKVFHEQYFLLALLASS